MLVLPQTFLKVQEKLSILKRCVFFIFPGTKQICYLFFSIGVFFCNGSITLTVPTGVFFFKNAKFCPQQVISAMSGHVSHPQQVQF